MSDIYYAITGGIAVANNEYKRVLYTIPDKFQLAVMSVENEIPTEVHVGVAQLFQIEAGHGIAVVEGEEYELCPGTTLVVPPGYKHRIINTGFFPLKLYTTYTSDKH